MKLIPFMFLFITSATIRATVNFPGTVNIVYIKVTFTEYQNSLSAVNNFT